MDDLAGLLKPVFEKAGLMAGGAKLVKVAAVVQERIITLDDAIPMGGFFFREEVAPDPADLIGKGLTPRQSADVLSAARQILADQPAHDPTVAEEALRALAERLGYKPGVVFGILRAAVTGQSVSPPLFASMEIIGREVVLRRIDRGLTILRTMKG